MTSFPDLPDSSAPRPAAPEPAAEKPAPKPAAERPAADKSAEKPAAKKGRRLRRWLLRIGIAVPLLAIGLWIAVHRIGWLGPWIADSLRSVLGARAVAELENAAYGVEDFFNRWVLRRGEEPQAYWEVPSTAASAGAPAPQPSAAGSASATAGSAAPEPPPFRPADVGPQHKTIAAKGDGLWVPVVDYLHLDPDRDRPILYKTLIHPDKVRPWAELFVVAMDLSRIDLHLMAGAYEPQPTTPEGRGIERPALVPEEHRQRLIAVFNGSFKTQHGRWGMRIGGVTLVKPRRHGCTVARYEDGTIAIAKWPDLEKEQERLQWWRQSPPCLYQGGKMHGGLWDDKSRGWGATVEGDTVIRRSALGLSGDRKILYMGVSNATTARVLADGMLHAGAKDITTLDVNWSYPRFVVFRHSEAGETEGHSLFPGFNFDKDEYLRRPAVRDFYYVLRKAP